MAGLYCLFAAGGPGAFFLLILAGTFGNLADSVFGALFERQGLLSNDSVNFLNTLLAAGCAGALDRYLA